MRYVQDPKQPIKIPTKSVYYHLDMIGKRSMFFKLMKEDGKDVVENRIVGMICGGDWDLPNTHDCTLTPMIKTRIFKYMYRHFELGMSWRESEASWKPSKLKRVEETHNNIKEEGYKSQIELGEDSAYEIEVCVGRDGTIFHKDGFHRMSSAMLLDVKDIYVIVNVWHEKFIKRAIQKGVKPIPRHLRMELKI